MKFSVLQLNTFADIYWDKLVSFLTSHDFDILQLQELSGKDTISGIIHSRHDTYKELNALLQENYSSELAIANNFTSNPTTSYMGNATFYKKQFILQEKHIIPLYQRTSPFPSDAKSFEKAGRNLLHLKLLIDGKTISFLNAHLAWAKTSYEEPHQTEQGEKFLSYLEQVQRPWILSGDFNLNPQQPTIQKINQLAWNLTSENHITNTLNPRNHRAKGLFPKGIAVDYMYVTDDITVKDFSVIEEDISDHFGLQATYELYQI